MNMQFTAHSAQTETLDFGGCGAGRSWYPEAISAEGYTPLPAGDYTLEIVESEYVPTCDGLGMVLRCKAQVVGGPYEGRPYWLNYCLEHQNDERMEAGQRAFAGLRRATGVLSPNFSTDLHFKPFRVKIGVQERPGANVIVQYLFEPDDAPIAA